MSRALIIVDIQNDYFPGGAMPLVGPEQAASQAARALEAFRGSGETVIHVQHVWDEPDATFMVPGTPGIEIHATVRPEAGERVISKTSPNAFLDTDLAFHLAEIEAKELVIAGMMTSMCIDSTVRAAAEQGFHVRLLHDACAAPALSFGSTEVPGNLVHAAFIAALGDGFAEAISTDDWLAERKPK